MLNGRIRNDMAGLANTFKSRVGGWRCVLGFWKGAKGKNVRSAGTRSETMESRNMKVNDDQSIATRKGTKNERNNNMHTT